MKLRIAHVGSNDRMAGYFVVQERRWLCWYDLYFDKGEDKLVREPLLGSAQIVDGQFEDFHLAQGYAHKFKAAQKARIIKEVWHV